MALVDDYGRALKALLPRGAAWEMEEDDSRYLTLLGLAGEFERLHLHLEQLIEEADPRTTVELLPDWEAALGLSVDGTEAERQGAIAALLTGRRELNKPFFVALAGILGVVITIDYFSAFSVGVSGVGEPIGGGDWLFAWQVNAPAATSPELRSKLETLFKKLKPSHTVIVFVYA